MREILFRGKRTGNGEWVYGYPLIDNAECSLKEAGKCKCPHDGSFACISFWNDELHEYSTTEVVHSTVGQYTGLTDKNGVKIFEGDIVNCYDLDFSAKIEWDDEDAMFGIVAEADCLYVTFDNYFGKDLEIIGNIHDNPELIER